MMAFRGTYKRTENIKIYVCDFWFFKQIDITQEQILIFLKATIIIFFLGIYFAHLNSFRYTLLPLILDRFWILTLNREVGQGVPFIVCYTGFSCALSMDTRTKVGVFIEFNLTLLQNTYSREFTMTKIIGKLPVYVMFYFQIFNVN